MWMNTCAAVLLDSIYVLNWLLLVVFVENHIGLR
jgi:hypothetical protein